MNGMKQVRYKVGIVGHRYLGGLEAENYVRFCCYRLLAEFKAKYSNLTAVSAVSEGADTIFSEVALHLDIELNTVIPFNDFSADFDSELSLEKCNALRYRSTKSEFVNFSKRSMSAYKKSMDWVVIKSHSLIGVWDGRCIGSPSGTGRAIELAKAIGKPVFQVNPLSRTLDYCGAANKKYFESSRLKTNEIGGYV